MYDDANCRKCNKVMDSIDFKYDGGLCEECNSKKLTKFVTIGIILAIIGLIIGSLVGIMNYNYEIIKCENLESSESNYDFDLKIEKNAEYNNNCYYLKNHPLVIPEKIFLSGTIGFIISILIVMMIYLISTMGKIF